MLETQLGVRVSEFLGYMVPGECLELDTERMSFLSAMH